MREDTDRTLFVIIIGILFVLFTLSGCSSGSTSSGSGFMIKGSEEFKAFTQSSLDALKTYHRSRFDRFMSKIKGIDQTNCSKRSGVLRGGLIVGLCDEIDKYAAAGILSHELAHADGVQATLDDHWRAFREEARTLERMPQTPDVRAFLNRARRIVENRNESKF